MDQNFLRSRLALLSKKEIINEMKHPRNSQVFLNYNWSSVDGMTKEQLIEIIAGNPAYRPDSNYMADLAHAPRKVNFNRLKEAIRNVWKERIRYINSLTHEQVFQFLIAPASYQWLTDQAKKNLSTMSRDDMIELALSRPEMAMDPAGNERSWNPDYWKPKRHQVEHYQTLAQGLMSPLNSAQFVLDGSIPGRGKTITTILAAIELGVANIQVICPGPVVPKWIMALEPLGLFNARVSTYEGIKGTSTKLKVMWAKYKPDPRNPSYNIDNDWVQITKSGKKGNKGSQYDFSFLPELGENGTGGTLVVWDEVHRAKATNTSQNNEMFNQFVRYLKDLNSPAPLDPERYRGNLSKRKYVRSIALTGSMIEKIEDMPYILNALGYIDFPSGPHANKFINGTLKLNFRRHIGSDWKPWYNNITDANKMLLVYFRIVGRRKKIFSQIPDPIDYVLYRTEYTSSPYPEDRNDFINRVLVPNFRQIMGTSWCEEMNTYDRNSRLIAFLGHLNRDPKFKDLEIQKVIDSIFENAVTFQALKLRQEDIEAFKRINREIGNMLELLAAGLISTGSVLGQIQTALTQLEVFKLAPFTEVARHALGLELPNGARPSVVISMLRNGSVRQFAWKLEAVLEVFELQKLNLTEIQIHELRQNWITAILDMMERQNSRNDYFRQNDEPLTLYSSFQQYSVQELSAMNMEDLCTEFIRWTYFLNVDKFQHVCIFVGEFGVGASSLDMDSTDEYKHIKDSKSLTSAQKLEAKRLFKDNTRRVFITNPNISAEGIDLHDVSLGGMHPRVMLMSPGIIANRMLQMSKRVAREEQTSESFTIMGYVDNISGNASWEARMMTKLEEKANQIQLLHTSEITVNVPGGSNNERETSSFLEALKADMIAGRLAELDKANPGVKDMGIVKRTLYENLSGQNRTKHISAGGPCTFASASEYLATAKVIPTKSAQSGSSPSPFSTAQPINNNLPSLGGANLFPGSNSAAKPTMNLLESVNYACLLFDTEKLKLNGGLDRMKKDFITVMESLKMTPQFYMFDDRPYRQELKPGVLIFRRALFVRSVEPSVLKMKLEQGMNTTIVLNTAQDRDFGHLRFIPELTIPKFIIGFYNNDSVMFAPPYPAKERISQDLYNLGFEIKPYKPGIMLITGDKNNIAIMFYALVFIYREAVSGMYLNLNVADGENVRRSNGDLGKFRYETRQDGRIYVAGGINLTRVLPLIIGLAPQHNGPVREGKILDLSSYVEENGQGTYIIMPDYVVMMKEFIDEANR
tara:strand:- start:64097 stop:67885 length:3789 start_codon:yes stop_codon:yes gene_type:complete